MAVRTGIERSQTSFSKKQKGWSIPESATGTGLRRIRQIVRSPTTRGHSSKTAPKRESDQDEEGIAFMSTFLYVYTLSDYYSRDLFPSRSSTRRQICGLMGPLFLSSDAVRFLAPETIPRQVYKWERSQYQRVGLRNGAHLSAAITSKRLIHLPLGAWVEERDHLSSRDIFHGSELPFTPILGG